MKIGLKKLYHYIAGNDDLYGFEHRVFNLTSFVITLFGIQATLLNYFLSLHIATVWLGILGTFVSAFLFYLARVKRWFTSATIFIYVIATIVVLGVMHFFNAAASGTMFYLLIMLLNIFLIIAKKHHQLWIYALIAGTIILLLLLEWFFPEWVIPYESASQRMGDFFSVLVYTLFFTMIVIVLFRRSYDREQNIVMEQKKQLEASWSLTKEKNQYIESLIHELHHRVKNNLQVVSGLLSLQSNRLRDETARVAMDEGRKRIDAMALIHQRLYMDKDLAAVDAEDYLNSLTWSLAGSYGYTNQHVHTDVNLPERSMHIDLMIPIGLIVNELVTNAFKHAFANTSKPQIKVSLSKNEDGSMELIIADNGTGFVITNDTGSFGMKLVSTLVDQLNGEMQMKQDNGTTYTIQIRA